jgi:hypothetical protein
MYDIILMSQNNKIKPGFYSECLIKDYQRFVLPFGAFGFQLVMWCFAVIFDQYQL